MRKRRHLRSAPVFLILVVRELAGPSQRALARRIGTSQPSLATLETGNRTPTIRTLMRVAAAGRFELVIGLRRPNAPTPDPTTIHAQGFDLIGTLRPNPEDGLADFVVLREPSPFEVRPETRAQLEVRAARFSS